MFFIMLQYMEIKEINSIELIHAERSPAPTETEKLLY